MAKHSQRPERRPYLTAVEYEVRGLALVKFTRRVMLDLARHDLTNRQVILRNALGRTSVLLRSIFKLYELGDIQDCWVLNRCLMDRLLTIYDLVANDSFDAFADWSFVQQFEARNRVRSSREFRNRIDLSFYKDTDEHTRRYKALVNNPPRWARPKPEAVAKQRKMGFLYSFGYDFGSAMVHPMADDGQEDFHLVTGLPSRRPHVDQRVVLHNSVLCAAMVANEVLSEVGFLWRRPATEFLHDLSASLVTGDDRYRASLGRVEAFGLTNPIGRPRPEGPP